MWFCSLVVEGRTYLCNSAAEGRGNGECPRADPVRAVVAELEQSDSASRAGSVRSSYVSEDDSDSDVSSTCVVDDAPVLSLRAHGRGIGARPRRGCRSSSEDARGTGEECSVISSGLPLAVKVAAVSSELLPISTAALTANER